MRIILFVLAIALSGLMTGLSASSPMFVDKLIYISTDLSAVSAPKDLNGQQCGLLKVMTDDKSMTFEGSVIGIPEYKNGEYWVYLPAGTYQIRLKSVGKEPLNLNFKVFNLDPITSKATYELSFNNLRDQEIASIYLTNAYKALHTEKFRIAQDYYQKYQAESGKQDKLFENELNQCLGLYNWSEEELLEAGFKIDRRKDMRFALITNQKGETGLIDDSYKDSRIIDGNIVNGYIHGLTLLYYGGSYMIAYICQGKFMAPSISKYESPLMMIEDKGERFFNECLWIEETVIANEYHPIEGGEGAEPWLPYVKQIFSPDVTSQTFLYHFSRGEVDMGLMKRNFSKFIRSGERIPLHLWGVK